jgi:hypothetical protein
MPSYGQIYLHSLHFYINIQDQHSSLIIQNRFQFLHYMAYNLLRGGGIMRSFLAQMDQFIGLLMPAGRYPKHTYTVQYICTIAGQFDANAINFRE